MSHPARLGARFALLFALAALLALPASAGSRHHRDRDRGHSGWVDQERLCRGLIAHIGFVEMRLEKAADRGERYERRLRGVRALLLLFADWFGCELPSPEPPEPPPSDAPPPDTTLLAEGGIALADLGRLEVDGSRFRVPFATPFLDPVVILAPPSERDPEPGVARIESVEADGFVVRFAEWSHLDGEHASEALSYLILAPGRHQLADGSEWEVGVVELKDTGVWSQTSFGAPFPEAPELFLSVQGDAEDDPVVARARELSAGGFQAALFEEEGADGTHGAVRVGYLAVHAAASSGTGRIPTRSGSLPFLLRRVTADHRALPILSSALRVAEEASADAEVEHADEDLSLLALGPHLFAQDVSSRDLDTASLRARLPEHDPLLEWGTLPMVDSSWHDVPLARRYSDPVVTVGPMSSDAPEPGVIRVRQARADAFQVRVQPWAYLGSVHEPERIFYLVADPGIQRLAGLTVQAGHVESDRMFRDGLEPVTLPLALADTPAVFASVMSQNQTTPVTVRVGDRSPAGFGLTMQHEQANANPHRLETLGWVAIERGRGTTSDGRRLIVDEASVDHLPVRVPFGEVLRGRFPVLVARIASLVGGDPVELRYRGLDAEGATLALEEEASKDAELDHVPEDVALFVAD